MMELFYFLIIANKWIIKRIYLNSLAATIMAERLWNVLTFVILFQFPNQEPNTEMPHPIEFILSPSTVGQMTVITMCNISNGESDWATTSLNVQSAVELDTQVSVSPKTVETGKSANISGI